MTGTIDLNCDMGELDGSEGLAHDCALLTCVSSANVACGGHAGNRERMQSLAELCREHDIAFGAHPGYEDRAGFGRVAVVLTVRELASLLERQIALALDVARVAGVELAHIKLHGALYNAAAAEPDVARCVARVVRAMSPRSFVFALAGSALVDAANGEGLFAVPEAFPDRGYQRDGLLVPRTLLGAVFHDPQEIAERAVRIASDGLVQCDDGSDIRLDAKTICLHGDHPAAIANATLLRRRLEAAGIHVARWSQ